MADIGESEFPGVWLSPECQLGPSSFPHFLPRCGNTRLLTRHGICLRRVPERCRQPLHLRAGCAGPAARLRRLTGPAGAMTAARAPAARCRSAPRPRLGQREERPGAGREGREPVGLAGGAWRWAALHSLRVHGNSMCCCEQCASMVCHARSLQLLGDGK